MEVAGAGGPWAPFRLEKRTSSTMLMKVDHMIEHDHENHTSCSSVSVAEILQKIRAVPVRTREESEPERCQTCTYSRWRLKYRPEGFLAYLQGKLFESSRLAVSEVPAIPAFLEVAWKAPISSGEEKILIMPKILNKLSHRLQFKVQNKMAWKEMKIS